MPETTRDFPCFACGSVGPHQRVHVERDPVMTDAEWAQYGATAPPLIICGACQERIWEPDTGDGAFAPNLTLIRPALRVLAHQALAARDLPRFLLLAEGHHRALLAEDNVLYFRQRELWDDVILAKLHLEQTD